MNIRFTTPCIFEHAAEGFGCASFGFAGAPDPAAETVREWTAQHKEINGNTYYGRLEDVIAQIPEKAALQNGRLLTGREISAAGDTEQIPWQAGIVLFGNCGGENEFIRKLYAKTKCPLTGGAAACDPVTGKSGLIASRTCAMSEAGTAENESACGNHSLNIADPGNAAQGKSQVTVFMICDPEARVTVESKNIHNNVLSTHRITYTDPRVFDTIDGEDAVEWYTKKRAEYGFGPDDFEHMTLSDPAGVNAHTSMSGGRLVSGRDLCPEMVLRYVKRGEVYPQMKAFYDDKDAMIFGCAGLKGILEQDIMTDTMGMFMFGEAVTINGVPEFGNLMLSKLVIKK